MRPFLELVDILLNLYTWVVIIWAILSTLISFNVINTHNRIIPVLMEFLYRMTEPALRPIRRVIPNIGGVDLSPLVLILIIWLVRRLMHEHLL